MRLPLTLAEIDWDGHMDLDGLGWLMVLGMLAFWALVVVGLVWLVREVTSRPRPGDGAAVSGDATEILRRRLAEGEISVEEFEERRRVLEGEQGG